MEVSAARLRGKNREQRLVPRMTWPGRRPNSHLDFDSQNLRTKHLRKCMRSWDIQSLRPQICKSRENPIRTSTLRHIVVSPRTRTANRDPRNAAPYTYIYMYFFSQETTSDSRIQRVVETIESRTTPSSGHSGEQVVYATRQCHADDPERTYEAAGSS